MPALIALVHFELYDLLRDARPSAKKNGVAGGPRLRLALTRNSLRLFFTEKPNGDRSDLCRVAIGRNDRNRW
jgi:hypothetical protein